MSAEGDLEEGPKGPTGIVAGTRGSQRPRATRWRLVPGARLRRRGERLRRSRSSLSSCAACPRLPGIVARPSRNKNDNHDGVRPDAGRKPFQPTSGDRLRVRRLVGFGLRQEEIAHLVVDRKTGRPISESTLRKHFAHEFAVGATEANSKVAESLFRKGTGDGPQSMTAAIWWTKC